MHYLALATDYDGTLATRGAVDPKTVAALERLKATGRMAILVTGRQLPDLFAVFPRLDLFTMVVAENGGILYQPAERQETALAAEPPARFVERLEAIGVAPLAVGRTIIATWEPHQTRVLETIRELGLELQIIFNKGAVMVLPPGVNKASGLAAALDRLGLSPINVVGIGDAENDHAFLDLCGCAVAVDNALPMVKEAADLVTAAPRGAGVAELIGRIVATDLADIDRADGRYRVPLAAVDDGGEAPRLAARGTNLLVAGGSGSGKSTFTAGLLERMGACGFQFCIIDPEGDYDALETAVVLGDGRRSPSAAEVMELLEAPGRNVVVNLLGVPFDDRTSAFADLAARLSELRLRTARPHWLVVDEAHHMLPEGWDRAPELLPENVTGLVLVTVHPNRLARPVLDRVDLAVGIGAGGREALRDFARTIGRPVREDLPALESGEMLLWDRHRTEGPRHCRVIPPTGERRRHVRKYAAGDLGDHSFHFRGPGDRLNLRVQNLNLFVQIAEGIDDETWAHHLRAGDYSRWFREAIKDDGLAEEAAGIEADRELTPADSRQRIREAIERRYTAPA
jgi:hypothetical protein